MGLAPIENLRHEISDLWRERNLPTHAILMVTHNIDEAVSMAGRQLDTAIDWGRYAEVFAYDDDTGDFFLEEDAPADAPAATMQ